MGKFTRVQDYNNGSEDDDAEESHANDTYNRTTHKTDQLPEATQDEETESKHKSMERMTVNNINIMTVNNINITEIKLA